MHPHPPHPQIKANGQGRCSLHSTKNKKDKEEQNALIFIVSLASYQRKMATLSGRIKAIKGTITDTTPEIVLPSVVLQGWLSLTGILTDMQYMCHCGFLFLLPDSIRLHFESRCEPKNNTQYCNIYLDNNTDATIKDILARDAPTRLLDLGLLDSDALDSSNEDGEPSDDDFGDISDNYVESWTESELETNQIARLAVVKGEKSQAGGYHVTVMDQRFQIEQTKLADHDQRIAAQEGATKSTQNEIRRIDAGYRLCQTWRSNHELAVNKALQDNMTTSQRTALGQQQQISFQ